MMRISTKKEITRKLFSEHGVADSSIERDILRIKDKELNESTKLKKIIRTAEEQSPRLSLFNEFLSCNVLSQVINTKIFGKYKKGIICVAADKIIRDNYNIIEKMWFGYRDDLKPSNIEEIQIDVDATKNVLVQGYYFLKHKESRKNVIFGVDFIDGWMTGYIAIYSNESESDLSSDTMKEILSWSKNNNFLKNKKINAMGQFVKVDKITMEDVILDREVKRRIKSGTVDMLANMEAYKQNGLPIKRGILMEGAPGTGKTLLAKALCNQIDSTFIWVTPDDVKYPEDISYIYQLARELAPTIILFEDIDYIGKSREDYGGSFDKITGELLNQMDGVESNEGIITIASSNYPKALDKALRNRPGRFDIRVRFNLPNEILRKEMLEKFFSEVNIVGIDIEDIVKKTDKYTGAYIKELTTATIMLAVTDGSLTDDGQAIILDSHISEAYNELEKSRKLDDIPDEES